MVAIAERGLWLPDAADRADLTTFAVRARRLDDAAVLRIRGRDDTAVTTWFATGFDVLACRVLNGTVRPDDLSAAADALIEGLAAGGRSGYVDPGYAMDSAWRGVLPPRTGYVHLDDVPARVVLDLPEPWQVVPHAMEALRPGGILHAATDHANYAEQIAEVGDAEPLLRRVTGPLDDLPISVHRPTTKYEGKAHTAGSPIAELVWERR